MAAVILDVEYENGDPFRIEVGPFQTILEIKEIIHAQERIPVAKQILKFHGHVFSDDSLFFYTNCYDERRIELGLALAEGETLVLDPPGNVERYQVASAFPGQPPIPYYGDGVQDLDIDNTDADAIFSSISPVEINELLPSDASRQVQPPAVNLNVQDSGSVGIAAPAPVHINVEMIMTTVSRTMVKMTFLRPGSCRSSNLQVDCGKKVGLVKKNLARKLCIHHDQLTLLLDGKILDDDEVTLFQCGISQQSALTLNYPGS